MKFSYNLTTKPDFTLVADLQEMRNFWTDLKKNITLLDAYLSNPATGKTELLETIFKFSPFSLIEEQKDFLIANKNNPKFQKLLFPVCGKAYTMCTDNKKCIKLKFLLECGYFPDVTTNYDSKNIKTPLVETASIKAVEYLLQYGANPHLKLNIHNYKTGKSDIKTPLEIAVLYTQLGKVKAIQNFLLKNENQNDNVNQIEDYSKKSLSDLKINDTDSQLIKFNKKYELIKRTPDPSKQYKMIIEAIKNSNPLILNNILSFAATLAKETIYGKNILYYLVEYRKLDEFKKVFEKNIINLYSENNSKQTLLEFSIGVKQYKIAQLVLNKMDLSLLSNNKIESIKKYIIEKNVKEPLKTQLDNLDKLRESHILKKTIDDKHIFKASKL